MTHIDGIDRQMRNWLQRNGLIHNDELTEVGHDVLVPLLRMLGQPWSRAIMEAMAANMPVITHELVILRGFGKDAQTLLVRRPEDEDDPWSGTVHMIGTVTRVTDAQAVDDRQFGTVAGFDGVTRRLVSSELPGCELERSAFLYERFTPGYGRALTIQRVHAGWLTAGSQVPPNAQWHPVKEVLQLEAMGAILPMHGLFVLSAAFAAGVIDDVSELLA